MVMLVGAGVAAWFLLGRNPAVVNGPEVPPAPIKAPVPPEADNFARPVKPAGPGKPEVAAPVTRATDLAANRTDSIKKATALILASNGSKGARGSGFVVEANGDTAYLITNHHVISFEEEEPEPPQQPKRFGPPGFPRPRMPQPGFPRIGPPGFGPRFGFPGGDEPPKEKVKVTVVFSSGTPAEQSLPAEVVAIDDEADLAALRVTGGRNLPAALDAGLNPPVAETQPIFVFGYPRKKDDTETERPAVSMVKGSISGLRRDDNGDLVDVHINGELNPGNSGGPAVDAEGRLVGVAVAAVPGKQIGFIVPTASLHKMFKGSVLGAVVCQVRQQGTRISLRGELWRLNRAGGIRDRDPLQVQFDQRGRLDIGADEYLALVRLTDPMRKINAAALHYALVPEGSLKSLAKARAPLPKARDVPLKITDQFATVNFSLDAGSHPDETYAFQLSYVNADGQTIFTEPHPVRLTFPKNLKSATVHIIMPTDDPSLRYVEDTMRKTFAPAAVQSARQSNGVRFEIDPVEDPRDAADHVPLGKVDAIQGRTISISVEKLDLPVPGDDEIEKAIAELKSSDASVRKGAVDRLAKMYAPHPKLRADVAKLLEPLLIDKDFWTRQSACQAMSIWAGPENVKGLIAAIEQDDVMTRRAAMPVLTRFKEPAAAPAIAKLLLGLGERGEASKALKAIGPAAEKAVIPYLTHKDPWVAAEACHILKDVGTKESITPLEAVLENKPHFIVAPAAKAALEAIQARTK
jgi:S1-C subfamily serine protease